MSVCGGVFYIVHFELGPRRHMSTEEEIKREKLDGDPELPVDPEKDIEVIEGVVDFPEISKGEVDYSEHCTNWEYNLASQYPTKIIKKMARRGNLSEVCELFILEQRAKSNKKWEPVE